jgi:guanylate kinase
MAAPGRLFVISGPSGVGKSTVLGRAMQRLPHLQYSISLTTRAPRPKEQNGVHYHFVSREDFMQRVEQGEMAEWAEFNGNLYGTSLKVVQERLAKGKDILLEIEVQGALQIKRSFPDAVMIFIMPPSKQALEERLRKRGTEIEEVLQSRLTLAVAEMEQAHLYQHRIINDGIEASVEELVRLMS